MSHLHWGREYRTTPLRGQPRQARELADAGACLILGHHPHVMEPVELIKAKDGRRVLVAYSLGNFLSNQGGRSTLRITRLGVILKVELVRTELGVEVDSWDSMATWVHNRNIRIEGKRIEDVHVEAVPLMIKKLEREIMDEQDQRTKRALQKKILFYQGRIKAAEKILKRPRGDLEVSRAF